MNQTDGYATDNKGEEWIACCPVCYEEYIFTGVFDPGVKEECICGCVFTIEKVWINDNEYII